MTRSRIVLAIAGLLVIGACAVAYWLVRDGDDPSASRTASTAVRPSSPPAAAEIAAPRRDLARLDRQVRAQQDDPAVAAQSAAEVQPPMAAGPAELREARAEEERLHRAYIAGIDAAFRTEATDPQWSSATSSAIQAVVAGDESLRAFLRGVECRSHTCRVEITDDGSGKLDKILPTFVHQLAEQLPSVAADRLDDGRGTASMILYMSASDPDPPGSAQN